LIREIGSLCYNMRVECVLRWAVVVVVVVKLMVGSMVKWGMYGIY